MLLRMILPLLASLLVGCSSLTQQAQDAFIAELPSPYGTSFSDLKRHPGDVICGRYSTPAINGLHMVSGEFVYSEGEVYRRPTAQQLKLFCTDEPVAALEREFGLGPWEGGDGALKQIHADLRAITEAIAAHVATKGDAPYRNLQELAPPQADYLPAVPTDPWGEPYRYELGLGGRSQRDYQLYTLGADGQPGGTGADADVSLKHLPYLNRLSRL